MLAVVGEIQQGTVWDLVLLMDAKPLVVDSQPSRPKVAGDAMTAISTIPAAGPSNSQLAHEDPRL